MQNTQNIDFANLGEKLLAIRSFLKRVLTMIVNICSSYYFVQYIFEKEENGERAIRWRIYNVPIWDSVTELVESDMQEYEDNGYKVIKVTFSKNRGTFTESDISIEDNIPSIES